MATMAAMFGIGQWEILILGVLCLGGFVALVAVVTAYVLTTRKPRDTTNLAPCPDCGRLVSRLAKACPQCGRPLP